MKITKKQLKQIIKEELQSAMKEIEDVGDRYRRFRNTEEEAGPPIEKDLEEAEGGEEVMAAIEDVPKAAQLVADKVKKEIERLAEPSGLDPLVMAQAVAALITTD